MGSARVLEWKRETEERLGGPIVEVRVEPGAAYPPLLRQLLKDASLTELLGRAHALSVHYRGPEGNIHYIEMEYVDGPDLHQIVSQNGPLTYEAAADYVAQVANGMIAHSRYQGCTTGNSSTVAPSATPRPPTGCSRPRNTASSR